MFEVLSTLREAFFDNILHQSFEREGGVNLSDSTGFKIIFKPDPTLTEYYEALECRLESSSHPDRAAARVGQTDPLHPERDALGAQHRHPFQKLPGLHLLYVGCRYKYLLLGLSPTPDVAVPVHPTPQQNR